jgi:hypothetical protein
LCWWWDSAVFAAFAGQISLILLGIFRIEHIVALSLSLGESANEWWECHSPMQLYLGAHYTGPRDISARGHAHLLNEGPASIDINPKA